MNKMKKLLSVFMAFTMIFSLISATAVFAENTDPDALPEGYVDNSNEGMLELQADYEMQSNAVQLMSAAPSELAGKKVEIAFLIDASGSMSPYIAKVKENVTAMAQYFESAGVNLRMAVVRYGASQDSNRANVLKINGSSWHTSTAQLVETLSNIPANGGTECLSDAIGDILKKNPITNNTDLQWSSDAYKFAFVLTNDFDTGVEGSYYNDYGYATLNSTIPDLLSKRIPVSVVTNTSYFSRYNSLATETGGELYDISSSDYLQLLIDYANKCMDVALKANKAIYVLPGYIGSELYDEEGTGKKLFLNLGANSGFWELEEKLKFINYIEGSPKPGNVDVNASKDDYGVRDTYKILVERLKSEFTSQPDMNYDVKFFPYNWIGDLNDSVKRLEDDINKNGYDKVVFVTHSTGGLLASAYVAKSDTNKLKVEKAVLIAAPLYGTYASLFPLERGDSKKLFKDLGSFITDVGTLNEWVKAWAHNSPTTYQLLPSEEYLKKYPLTDKGGWGDDKKQVTTASAFYNVLNQSDNINSNLTNNKNCNFPDRSHKYFRETVLKDDIVSQWSLSSLQEINLTLIATPEGKNTPTTAVYSEPVFGTHRKLSDIKYTKKGDGTVLGFSATANGKFTDIEDDFTANHTDLVETKEVLDVVCNRIRAAATATGTIIPLDAESSVSLLGIAANAGMSDTIKIHYECDDVVTAKIYNTAGDVVATATGDENTGFEDEFIYDNFSDDVNTTDATIHMPNSGYKIVFTCGETAGKTIQFTSAISTLSVDGDKDLTINSTFNTTTDNGVITTLDGTDKSLTNDTVPTAIPGDVVDSFTEWNLPLSVKVNLNDVKKIAIEGSEADKVAGILTWESSDSSVVEVSNDGTITAKGYGRAAVSASNGDKVVTTEIIVENKATSVTLDDIGLVIGERKLIKPVFVPANTTETDMTYTMSKPDIIEIDEFGVITALAAGSVTVTGKTSYGVEDSFVVVVKDDTNYAVASIEIVPSTISVANGKTTTFKVKFTPENATNKELNWLIEDTSLISIAPSGEDYTITGLKEGSTKVTAISVDGGYTSDAIVNVTSRSSGGSGNTAFNITFETNGGSKISTKRVRKNTVLTAPANPTKEGYVFDGWYTNKELTKKYNFSNNVTKGFTLYAKWVTDEASTIVLTIGKKEAIVFGKTIENDVAPQVVNDRTMLPIRFIAEALGAEVIWNEEDPDKVTVKKDDIEIVINIGSSDALVKGKKVTLDSPAFIENDRTYLPLRFVSENLGAKVEWKEDTEQVIITK